MPVPNPLTRSAPVVVLSLLIGLGGRLPSAWAQKPPTPAIDAKAQAVAEAKAQARALAEAKARAEADRAEAEALASRLHLEGAAWEDFIAGYLQHKYGRHATALDKYRSARASKNPALLWYEAICFTETADYAKMARALTELAALPRAQVVAAGLSEGELDQIPERLSKAKPFVGPLHLLVNQPGAEVLVDGEPVGTTPLPRPPVLLNLGERKIQVRKLGFKPFEQVMRVGGGAEVPLTVTLERIVHEGRLAVDAGTDGLIWVDGKMVGHGRWEGVVASGGHTLRVTAPGKLPKEQEISIVDGERREIQVTLLDAPNRQWVKWAWVGVGGTVLTGAVIAGAVAARSSGATVKGTIDPMPMSFGGQR